MNEQERQKLAQESFQAALQNMAYNFGMTVEPILQVEAISETYTTSRALLILKPVVGWQPPADKREK